MSRRRSQPVPFGRWLASRNPTLRARAETALYHFGPDAGEALFTSADAVSRNRNIIRKTVACILSFIVVTAFFAFLSGLFDAHLTFVWLVFLLTTVLRLFWIIASDLYWRRERLKVLGLAMAKRNDLRGIGPLLEAWRPLSFWNTQIADDEIEAELIRLLPRFLLQTSMGLRRNKMRLLRRKIDSLFPQSGFQRRIASRGTLTDARVDLIASLLPMIIQAKSPQNRVLVERLSRLDASTPNERFLRDIALACLDAPAPPIIAPALHPMAHSAPPAHLHVPTPHPVSVLMERS